MSTLPSNVNLKLEVAGDADLTAATNYTQPVEIAGQGTLRATAVFSKGTASTADLTLQHSFSASGPFVDVAAFPQATGPSTKTAVFGPCARFVRLKLVLGGGAWRFSCSAEAV
jgi:hypothetical protein